LYSLTVEEHVWFYGRLKGLSGDEVRKELDTLLEDVGLLHKRHEQTRNLSGMAPSLYYSTSNTNMAFSCILYNIIYPSTATTYTLLKKIKGTLKQHNVTPSQSHFCDIKMST
jgi:hypothetical protein